MLTGDYLPGDSVLHRAAPGVKVALLAAFTIVLVALSSPFVVASGAALVVLGYVVARVAPRVALAQLKPLRWIVALLFAYQAWANGWAAAFVICGNLVVAVAAASLLTLTTRIDDLRAAVVRWLTRLPLPDGVAERAGLMLALVIRSIPVVASLAEQGREARVARGLERSPRALVTPLVVRTIRHAERVGDALAARGVDD